MKELLKHQRDSEKTSIEQVVKKQQQQEYKYIDSLRPKENHIVFEINPRTLEIKEAEYKKIHEIYWFDALKAIESGWKEEIVQKPGFVYISALNKNNALKRYKLGKGSAKRHKGIMSINLL